MQVEQFKFAQRGGSWLLTRYARKEPSNRPCDVNFISRRYSVNLLTGVVHDIGYSKGRLQSDQSHRTERRALDIASFDFSMFESSLP
jgi:hypothetical protein